MSQPFRFVFSHIEKITAWLWRDDFYLMDKTQYLKTNAINLSYIYCVPSSKETSFQFLKNKFLLGIIFTKFSCKQPCGSEIFVPCRSRNFYYFAIISSWKRTCIWPSFKQTWIFFVQSFQVWLKLLQLLKRIGLINISTK